MDKTGMMMMAWLRISWFISIALAMVLYNGIASAQNCPDLQSATKISGFDLSHFEDQEWEVSTKDGLFYVRVNPEHCLFILSARMGDHKIDQVTVANNWNQEQPISTAYIKDGAIWLRSSAYLHNANDKLLAANLFIFDLMAKEFLTTLKHDMKKKTAL
jgi:hypothetical protein